MINWIIGGLIVAATIFIIVNKVKSIKQGQCGCNCSGCHMASKCGKNVSVG
ncbi:MAG: FeoB-associated Cys-rich membrane protein [Ruminiclostridium sp.]|nr:FeoB-associated Cys-rich membrane protein [Ruminiclostridium sp.]